MDTAVTQSTASTSGSSVGLKSFKGFGSVRWGILILLFFATMLNYIDRQVIGLLKPTLSTALHWSEVDYANIVFFFQIAYAVGYVFTGRLTDKIGTKKGFFTCVGFWSLAAVLHGAARSVFSFSAARAALGFFEPGNFVCSLKSARMWFPKSERAFAIGVYNAGTNVGAMTAPFLVPWIVIKFGWQWAFFITGGLGFIWLIFWKIFYHNLNEHPTVSAKERAHIQAEPEPVVEKTPWSQVLKLRTTWAFGIGNMMPMAVFWFYLFWLPDFLSKTHGVKLMALGLPLMAIYISADIGSIVGGSLSSWFIKRGMAVLAARKLAMLVMLVFILPTMLAPQIGPLWGCVLIVCLAIGAHQGWTANMWSLVTDSLPERAVGSVFGIAGMLGSVAGACFAEIVGYVLKATHGNYYTLFIGIPCVYCIALLILHLFLPKEPEMV